ncbi:MAG: TraB/GumN family protein, partial [Chitinophagaceae bacterium]
DSTSAPANNTKELVAVYKDQDLAKIQAMTVQEDGVLSEYLDLLLYNRNADWAKKMSKLMPLNSILFAVGAAHLPGDKGVISLLKKQGYTLTPMAN